MRRRRIRLTELMAKELVEKLVQSGDLTAFLRSCLHYIHVYSRYSQYPAFLFCQSVADEFEKNISRVFLNKIASRIAIREFEKWTNQE